MLYDAYCWFMCSIGIGYFMEGPRNWLLDMEIKDIENNLKKVKELEKNNN